MRGVPTPRAAQVEIGRRVKAIRLEKGMTQQDVADRAVFLRTAVSCVELGKRCMTVGLLLELADALGVDPGVLVRDLPRE